MVRLILVILRVNTGNSGNSLGLYLFFLPQYSSEMNLIEAQWHQLKTHEIAGRIFDNEYDARNRHHQWNGESQSARRMDTRPSYV